MRVNDVGRITFRFTNSELEALLKLMDVSCLPGLELAEEPAQEAVIQSLAEDGIAIFCGERVLVDKTVSLILKSAAESRRRLTVRSSSAQVTLYQGELMCVLVSVRAGWVSIEPLQNPAAAQEPFITAAGQTGESAELVLCEGDERLAAGGLEALDGIYAQFERQ